MIWCRFQSGQKISFGILEGDVVTEVSGSPFDEHTVTSTTHQLSQVKLLAPVIPGMLYAAGRPYLPHAPGGWARRRKACRA